jgi:hypothetical protein
MAFSGNPVVVKVSDALARITGITLGSGSTGTIGLPGSGADVELPMIWAPYAGDDAGDNAVDLAEACEVSWTFVTAIPSSINPSMRIHVVKSDGDDPAAFLISLVSSDTLEAQSAELEIYVRFH